jgi:adenylate cyclase
MVGICAGEFCQRDDITERGAAEGPAMSVAGGPAMGSARVVAGLIGPDERVEYGVVGEPVNLASRVEGLTRDLAATILVSRDIAARLGPQFLLGRVALLPVKGRAQPVEVVEVLAHQAPDHTDLRSPA